MKLVDLNCPNCNLAMHVDENRKEVRCPYCGTTFAVDDEVKHIHYDNAEQAGYEFEKGRLRAQAEQRATFAGMAAAPYSTKQKRQNRTLWVLGWIFFFPAPLTIVIVRSKKINKTAKIVILSILWAVLLGLGIYLNATEPKSSTAPPSTTAPTQSAVMIDKSHTFSEL